MCMAACGMKGFLTLLQPYLAHHQIAEGQQVTSNVQFLAEINLSRQGKRYADIVVPYTDSIATAHGVRGVWI